MIKPKSVTHVPEHLLPKCPVYTLLHKGGELPNFEATHVTGMRNICKRAAIMMKYVCDSAKHHDDRTVEILH